MIPPGVGVGSPSDVTAFNPLLVTSLYNQNVVSFLFANLFWIGQDDRIDFSRSIAKKVEVFDNNTRYRVTMRPWPWSDGKPVTADDVLFAWELIQRLGENFNGYGQGGVPTLIKSVKLLNSEEFEVTLTRPVNPDWFELGGLSAFTPLPRHAWGTLSTDALFEAQSDPAYFKVVDGPFKIDSFQIGRSISFVDNPRYPLQHMAFKRFVEKFLQTGGSELQGIDSGEIDLANLPTDTFDARHSIKNVHLVPAPPTFAFTYMGLNFNNPGSLFFRDANVRQAIADSIDEKLMINSLWHGYGLEARSPVPANPPTYLSPEAKSGHYPVGYDPAKAAALLDAAGYKPGADGVRVKNGQRLEFTVLIPTGVVNELMIAQFMQPELRRIGIVMRIKMVDFNQMIALLTRKVAPWQAYILITSLGPYPSGELILQTGALQNWGGYTDPKMDRYIEESNDDPGLEGLYKYQDYAAEQQPVIFLPLLRYVVLERNGINGVEKIVLPAGNYEPQLLTLDKKLCDASR